MKRRAMEREEEGRADGMRKGRERGGSVWKDRRGRGRGWRLWGEKEKVEIYIYIGVGKVKGGKRGGRQCSSGTFVSFCLTYHQVTFSGSKPYAHLSLCCPVNDAFPTRITPRQLFELQPLSQLSASALRAEGGAGGGGGGFDYTFLANLGLKKKDKGVDLREAKHAQRSHVLASLQGKKAHKGNLFPAERG